MIVLDTNVISEVMRGPRADPAVLAWVRGLRDRPVTTVLNRAEILAGIALLPAGERRQRLQRASESAFAGLGVALPLVPECTSEYAEIVAARRRAGRPTGTMDALIASVVRVSGAQLATRDHDDFDGLGLDLLDPWAP